MALWNTDSIILTQKGREVLSKVQAGEGSLTVSRIVTGGGFVSPAQLYNQTSITDIEQVTAIIDVTTTEEGSSIEVQITNAELTEEYNLYQLGIYVVHSESSEEVLYLIAQCDTSNPDRVPLPTETPVMLNYSIFMAHSGTDRVNITVNQAGIVNVALFESHTNDLVIHTDLQEKEDISTHMHNKDLHVSAEYTRNVNNAINDSIRHLEDLDIHVTSEQKNTWDNTTEQVTQLQSDMVGALNTLDRHEDSIQHVENALFENITGNPYTILFDNLSGVSLSKGNWNKDRHRLEC